MYSKVSIWKKAPLRILIASLFLVPIFFLPETPNSFTQGKELIFKSIVLTTILALNLRIILDKGIKATPIYQSKLFILAITQLSAIALTNALSATPIASIYGTLSRGGGFILDLYLFSSLLILSILAGKKTIIRGLKAFFAGSLIVASYGILQQLGWDPAFKDYSTSIFGGRAFSFLGNPGYLGQFLLLSSIAGSYLLFSQKKYKAYYLTGIILFLTVLILSETRAAVLGLAVTLLISSIKYRKQIYTIIKSHKYKILTGLIILIIPISYLLPERFSFSDSSLRSVYSRMEIWKGTINLIKDRPLTGYGSETFYIYFPETVTKRFLTLEENLNISADKVHNELLETTFEHGIFGLIIYLVILGSVIRIFFRKKSALSSSLALIIIANSAQNQFSFSDLSISLVTVFALASLISLELKESKKISFKIRTSTQIPLAMLTIFICGLAFYSTIYKPFRSELAYAESKNNYSVNYETAIDKHKEALSYSPYYSELWYELMFVDTSSMARALFYLEQIDGNSGNVLAWKGNMHAESNPKLASKYYLEALEKNPNNPLWIRAFADMLYKQEDYVNALFLYSKYLDTVPDFWKWKDELEKRSTEDQKSYEAFMKQSPFFIETLKKIENLSENLNDTN